MILLGCLAASPAMGLSPSPDTDSGPGADQSGGPSAEPSQGEDAKASVAKDILSRIETGWPKYDATRKGQLTFAEFSSWMNDLRAENGNGPADDSIMRLAFALTDSTHDGTVSKDELTTFMLSRNNVKTSPNR
ncbi:MAG: hypothetical protein P8Y58_12740 [Novosphingobium sp.]